MSEQWAATPLYEEEQVPLWHSLLLRFEYLRYVEREVVWIKAVALILVFLLLLRTLFLLLPLCCPSRDLQRRAKQKKQC